MTSVPKSRFWCFALLASGALTADLVSKWYVFQTLGYPYRKSTWEWGCRLFWGDFHIQLFTTFNQGALFGIGQGWGWLFGSLSVVAVTGIVYWLFIRGEAKSWWLTITLALILAGALGNLYDRAYMHGCVEPVTGTPLTGVRDFIKCDIPGIRYQFPFDFTLLRTYEFPVFNLADSCLVTGAIMLTLYSLFAKQPAAKPVEEKSPSLAPPVSVVRT